METAIISYISYAKELRVPTVQDLKSAYDSVPRNENTKLVEKSEMNSEVLKTVSLTLQSVVIRAHGNQPKTLARITRGVCQGSPLRPMLFDIYMNTYVQSLLDCTAQ